MDSPALAARVERAVFGPPRADHPPDLDAFRQVQQQAYRSACAVAATLEPGVTERQAARRLRRHLEEAGVAEWFHVPLAWFGDRTTLRFKALPQFLPSNRRLEQGMAFILDCAPSVDGVTADIGLSGSLGDNALSDEVVGCLSEHRALILELVRERRTRAQVYNAVDRLAARQGLDQRHHAYPGRVLAHRVDQLQAGGSRPVVGAFGLRYLHALGTASRQRVEGGSPLWNGSRRSEHRPSPGLWAIEPHLSLRGVGAKFEELLVVTEEDAHWLDDDLPHVHRWGTGSSRTEAEPA